MPFGGELLILPDSGRAEAKGRHNQEGNKPAHAERCSKRRLGSQESVINSDPQLLPVERGRKEPQRIAQVLLPVRPLMATGEFLVNVRNPVRDELIMQFAVMREEWIVRTAIEAQRREVLAICEDRLQYRPILQWSMVIRQALLHEHR